MGEWLGGSEVPQLTTSLLDALWGLGCRTLAVEAQALGAGALIEWATGKRASPPTSFAHPYPDGRCSERTLRFYGEAIGGDGASLEERRATECPIS